MNYSWTVIINKMPYGVTCSKPWTAVSRALEKYCRDHPKSSSTLFDIYLVNRTLADKGKVISETFNKHRKELLADGCPDQYPDFVVDRAEDGEGEQEAGDKNAK